jgi:predicted MPP superfamily phosphohydrolase
LSGIPVVVLDNQAVRLPNGLALAGVDDYWEGPSEPSKAMRGLGGESAVILLSHNPDVNLQLATDKGVKLVLSGHTHGGQIRVPLFNLAPWVPCSPKYRGASGIIRETQHRWTFITKGVGTFFVPVRLFCRPDVGILRLTRA